MQIVLDFIIFFGSTFFGGVLGYLLKTQIDHRLTISRIYEAARVSEYNKAVSEFRAAFAPGIFKFKITAEFNAIEKMLKEELIPQGITIERFRPFVNNEEAYQEA